MNSGYQIEKHLIYFSYSEIDTKLFCTDEFKIFLENHIFSVMGDRLGVIYDKSQIPGNIHTKQLIQLIKSAELFLFISSTAYFRDEASKMLSCVEELQEFINEYGEDSGRIFIIKIQPLEQSDINNQKLYQLWHQISGYIFYENQNRRFITYSLSAHRDKIYIEVSKIAQDIKEALSNLNKVFIGVTLSETINSNEANSLERLEIDIRGVRLSLNLYRRKHNKLVFEGYSKDIQAAISEYDKSKKIKHFNLKEISKLKESEVKNYLSIQKDKSIEIDNIDSDSALSQKIFENLNQNPSISPSLKALSVPENPSLYIQALSNKIDIVILIYPKIDMLLLNKRVIHYERMKAKKYIKNLIILNFTSENINHSKFVEFACNKELNNANYSNFINHIEGLIRNV